MNAVAMTEQLAQVDGCQADADAVVVVNGAAAADSSLSERDQRVLTFERQWWKYSGAKDQAIRELFDLTPTQYGQLLNSLLDNEAALAFDPMLVKRLRRMRDSRHRARTDARRAQ